MTREPCDELAQVLGILRDIESSSRALRRAELLHFRRTLDTARLPGAARAAIEGAAWQLYRDGDGHIWQRVGGRPHAGPHERAAVLRRSFVTEFDPPVAVLHRLARLNQDVPNPVGVHPGNARLVNSGPLSARTAVG